MTGMNFLRNTIGLIRLANFSLNSNQNKLYNMWRQEVIPNDSDYWKNVFWEGPQKIISMKKTILRNSFNDGNEMSFLLESKLGEMLEGVCEMICVENMDREDICYLDIILKGYAFNEFL